MITMSHDEYVERIKNKLRIGKKLAAARFAEDSYHTMEEWLAVERRRNAKLCSTDPSDAIMPNA